MKFLSNEISIYQNEQVAFLTQHEKEHVVAPVIDSALACHVKRVTGYDTDLLGTFTRDIAREETQIETARKKARIGMQLSDLPLGLGSEGSFGADPFTQMLPWNVEFLVWIDDKHDLEIIAMAQGGSNLAQILTSSWEEAEIFAKQAGFPKHYLVIRPQSENDIRISKGIAEWSEFKKVFLSAMNEAKNNHVYIQTDMRANANPTRMENIRLAGEELAQKLSSTCPSCNTPGYWSVEQLRGLPCEVCTLPTQEIRADIYACCKCSYRDTIERKNSTYADAGLCEYCNP